jgi:hypothetical protein
MRKGTKDDVGIADFSRMKPVKSSSIGRVRYVKLSEIKKDKRKSLKDPQFKFRHKKDREDLERMKYFGKKRRR